MALNIEIKYLAERLKKLRTGLKMTQQQLGKLTGVNYSTIGKIENNKEIPSIKLLLKIAKVLEVDISYFFKPVKNSLLTKLSSYSDEQLNLLDLTHNLEKKDLDFVSDMIKIIKKHKTKNLSSEYKR